MRHVSSCVPARVIICSQHAHSLNATLTICMAHELSTSSLSEKLLTPFIVILLKLAYIDFQVTLMTFFFGEAGLPSRGQFCNKPTKV